MYGLLVHAAPAQRGWALVGVLFGFSSHLLFGYLNYALGLGLVFCWLALWYPRRADASWTARLLLGFGAMVLFLVHLTAPKPSSRSAVHEASARRGYQSASQQNTSPSP